ncbi:RsmB/NOP family class I SAM-dependent RNA methyltransferase [Limisalsivibrio acetivorans]|uniref:RsmB/NOP family class I SAM-dependent RNA methyltransferase n=1 Tax=Limisalsivibrio acetivorans TaxID=1304888 RepID=UPI0003B31320|nr:RsmB/NOP family class I SAM-dependent RNA methyltransferase [Limisalsivibrio acetivorans]
MNKEFESKYRELLGAGADAFFDAMQEKPGRFIRKLNKRNTDYIDELKQEGFNPLQDSMFEEVFSVTETDQRLTDTVGFITGGFYIMNPSSVFPAESLTQLMPENPLLLDVSAAPGGKTVAMADMLLGGGLVIANEPSKKRLRSLEFNLEKHGCHNVRTSSMDGRVLHKAYEGVFDGILLDAPCSNENKIARNDTVNREWCTDLVERMAKLQAEIALSAWECLKPGGVLVYSTCTFSPEENEDIVAMLMEERGAELVDISEEGAEGLSGNDRIDSRVLRVMPHRMPYDGFFVSALRKPGGELKPTPAPNRLNGRYRDYFKKELDNLFTVKAGDRILLQSSCHNDIRGRFSRSGLTFMKREGELSSQTAWEFGAFLKDDASVNIQRDEALQYLKGFDIPKSTDYHNPILYWGSMPVGVAKAVEGRLKNKLDRYFLYGRNIEF